MWCVNAGQANISAIYRYYHSIKNNHCSWRVGEISGNSVQFCFIGLWNGDTDNFSIYLMRHKWMNTGKFHLIASLRRLREGTSQFYHKGWRWYLGSRRTRCRSFLPQHFCDGAVGTEVTVLSTKSGCCINRTNSGVAYALSPGWFWEKVSRWAHCLIGGG